MKVHEESNIGALHRGLGATKMPGLKPVSDGIKEGAPILAADIAMSAADVGETIREVRASTSEGRAKRTVLEEAGSAKKPRFQHLMWSRAEAGVTPAATYTEVAAPVPVIPDMELRNESVTDLINKHPELFKIVTPLNSSHHILIDVSFRPWSMASEMVFGRMLIQQLRSEVL